MGKAMHSLTFRTLLRSKLSCWTASRVAKGPSNTLEGSAHTLCFFTSKLVPGLPTARLPTAQKCATFSTQTCRRSKRRSKLRNWRKYKSPEDLVLLVLGVLVLLQGSFSRKSRKSQ